MKRRSIIIGILLVIFLISTTAFAEYWASKQSNKYHLTTCQWAQKINPSNLIKFNTPEDAVKAGYVPCKVCKPPVSSRADLSTTIVGERDEQRRGCCSWHGGVCGCRGGRAVCCDGTLSPTCGCD